MLRQFKEAASAPVRRDKFVYVEAIRKEQATLVRVKAKQQRFAAMLGSLFLSGLIGLSNLASMYWFQYSRNDMI